ncbi:M20 family metallopeptidase [Sphaerobacter thermophilus]|uniref:M20 family metallopeptidase n=1 Tax=Sphaerobacter thermophilus TaxID=2057 RepID=UPI0039C43D28
MTAEISRLMELVDAAADEVVRLTQDLVRIPTVNFGTPESGDEMAAATFLRDKLAEDGIDATIYAASENRGNLVATLGDGNGPRLLFMSHTDVVPVEDPDQWTYPPFSGEIADGRIWGRGASDMKGTVAAQAMALILLKRAGVPLKGTLTFATCADEEAGGAYGFGWMAKHHPDVLRADFAVNEGGGGPVRHDGRLIYPISTGEKGRLEIHIRIRGRGWHASQPWRADNAIYKAEEVIRRIRAWRPEVSTRAEIFQHLDTLAGITEPVTDENIDQVLAELEKRNPNLASMLRAASRMTLVATMIQAGVKSNSVAESCTIICDVRSLPWQDVEYVRRQVAGILEGLDGVSFEVIETAVSNASPYDSPFREAVEAATRDAIGVDDIAFVPGISVGFTDSRFVRPLGNVTYGFVPSAPTDDPSRSGAHNINESIGIDSVIAATKFHVALAYRLLTRTS